MRLPIRGLVALLVLGGATPLAAQPLTFDDLPSGTPVAPGLGATHGGLEFSDNVLVSDGSGPYAYGAGAVSGSNFATIGPSTGLLDQAEIYFPAGNFTGAGGWFGVRSTAPVTSGFLVSIIFSSPEGDEQAVSFTVGGTAQYVTLDAPFVSDAIYFDTSSLGAAAAGTILTIDNLAVTVTPEPATMALLATGLVGVAFVARMRRRRGA